MSASIHSLVTSANDATESGAPVPITHVMIDTETLGLAENAIVMSIGACTFSLENGVGEKFYTEIDPTTYAGSVDIPTILFWFQQAAAGNAPPIGSKIPAPEALNSFHIWLLNTVRGEADKLRIWFNGSDFDSPKMGYMYKMLGATVPWKYNAVRDCRTIFRTFPSFGDETTNETKHNALSDSVWQAEKLVSVVKQLSHYVEVEEFFSE